MAALLQLLLLQQQQQLLMHAAPAEAVAHTMYCYLPAWALPPCSMQVACWCQPVLFTFDSIVGHHLVVLFVLLAVSTLRVLLSHTASTCCFNVESAFVTHRQYLLLLKLGVLPSLRITVKVQSAAITVHMQRAAITVQVQRADVVVSS
jgi:hypothetical protein